MAKNQSLLTSLHFLSVFVFGCVWYFDGGMAGSIFGGLFCAGAMSIRSWVFGKKSSLIDFVVMFSIGMLLLYLLGMKTKRMGDGWVTTTQQNASAFFSFFVGSFSYALLTSRIAVLKGLIKSSDDSDDADGATKKDLSLPGESGSPHLLTIFTLVVQVMIIVFSAVSWSSDPLLAALRHTYKDIIHDQSIAGLDKAMMVTVDPRFKIDRTTPTSDAYTVTVTGYTPTYSAKFNESQLKSNEAANHFYADQKDGVPMARFTSTARIEKVDGQWVVSRSNIRESIYAARRSNPDPSHKASASSAFMGAGVAIAYNHSLLLVIMSLSAIGSVILLASRSGFSQSDRVKHSLFGLSLCVSIPLLVHLITSPFVIR